jgi:manganese oxidase
MNTSRRWTIKLLLAGMMLLCATTLLHAHGIPGVTGTVFNFTAKSDYISTPDGNSIHMWGFALNNGRMQYPGPTLTVNEGDSITINLNNRLSVPVSIVFPGQSGVTASGGVPGLLTNEAPPDNGFTTVTYTFVASKPGTYTYYSGTRTELQVEMGLVGAIIVRPSLMDPMHHAYNHMDSMFDHEYLFLLTEIDPVIHELVASGRMNDIDNTTYWPVYWLINGRAAPDTMGMDNDPLLPTQPYSCMPMMHPGDKVLMRMIGAGRAMHPFHTHGNHHRVIARDGRLLESAPGSGSDLSELAFTTTVIPGSTADAIYTWTGEKLGWDMYGHTDPTNTGKTGAACVSAGVPLEPNEYLPDHCKSFPVILPTNQDLTFGLWYSGSPFLGSLGTLPPGEGGYNPNGGFFFMWHSHNEKEITNNNIFPGGLLTMIVIEHPSVIFMNP